MKLVKTKEMEGEMPRRIKTLKDITPHQSKKEKERRIKQLRRRNE